jgi:hypothetical protein
MLTGIPAMVAASEGVKVWSNGSVMMVFCKPTAVLVAVMMLPCDAATAAVVMGKLALVAPAGTVTVAGTVIPPGAFNVKVVPPPGAAALNAMLPMELLPPTSSCGPICNEFTGCNG